MEMSLLEILFKAWTESSADLAFQVASDTFALELNHPEHLADMSRLIVLFQLCDPTNMLAVETLEVRVCGAVRLV